MKYKVLIVDDVPRNIQLAAKILKNEKIDISFTTNGRSALEIINSEKLDLVILDLMMPEMSGMEVLKELKRSKKNEYLPVIFLTAKSEIDSVVKALDEGAVDYVTKPFNGRELVARVNTHLELKRSKDSIMKYVQDLESASKLISEKNIELEKLLEKVKRLSNTDSLTGLNNRRSITTYIENEEKRFGRNGEVFSIVICDIDNFKNINDTYGHNCGDSVLKRVAYFLTENIREIDIVSRWGGEEFLILLPNTKESGGEILAEKLREIMDDKIIFDDGDEIKISLTFGVAEYNSLTSIDELINNADKALYHGKKNGKNIVCAFSNL